MNQTYRLIMSTLLFAFMGMVLLSSCNSSPDQAFVISKDAVQFSSQSLQQAKDLGKKDNKPIFLFAHASYCSACKEMKKTVFPDVSVGELFNNKFINTQVDIESAAGKAIVELYGVEATPTLLFLDAGGQVIKKTSGFHNKEELLASAEGF